ncbi:MAG: hypothetical protein ACK5CY_03640 [Bacteroidia bacterium]|jgi:hypothetical protein
MSSEFKCKNCGSWNPLQDEAAVCLACNTPYKVFTEADRASIERRNTTGDIKIPIHPNDAPPIKVLKHIFNAIQIAFLAVLSFILWLIAAGPG